MFGEKVDIIPFSTSVEKFIAAALAPAKVTDVELDKTNTRAIVSVPEDQQSLAIGKEGQNARLANKLTKWKIDIKSANGVFETEEVVTESAAEAHKKKVVGIWDAAIKETEKHEKAAKEKAEKEAAEAEETKEEASEEVQE